MSSSKITNHPGSDWNAGGWFGSQIGASCWILVAGILVVPHNLPLALVLLGLFYAVNQLGYLIWKRRTRLSLHVGLQWLLGMLGSASLLAVYLLDRAGLYTAMQTTGTVSAQTSYWLIVGLTTALMARFYFQFGRQRR